MCRKNGTALHSSPSTEAGVLVCLVSRRGSRIPIRLLELSWMREGGTNESGLVVQTARRWDEVVRASLETLTRGQRLEGQNGAPLAPQILFLLHSAAAMHLIASGQLQVLDLNRGQGPGPHFRFQLGDREERAMKLRTELRVLDLICQQAPAILLCPRPWGSQDTGLSALKLGQSPAKRGDELATLWVTYSSR